jgi:hypothetical protein
LEGAWASAHLAGDLPKLEAFALDDLLGGLKKAFSETMLQPALALARRI